MKSFSPAGMAAKALYGYSRELQVGAKTFGNPDGNLSGNGAYAAGGHPVNTLNLTISADHISSGAGLSFALFLTDLMTSQQQTDWANGVYGALNLSGSGAPPRGYWVVAGLNGGFSSSGDGGMAIDLLPARAVTISVDSSILRFYGGGGSGGNESSGIGADGGAAFAFIAAGTADLRITNTIGAHTGRFMAGGGGGSGGSGGGGGGAGGWSGGNGEDGGQVGGVYDPAHGGTGNADVAGGAGFQSGGAGGGLGQDGFFGTFGSVGAGGAAVARNGTAGTTTVLSGGGPNFLRGAVG